MCLVTVHSVREHVELLRLFLSRREEIVKSIEGLLNDQRKRLQDPTELSRRIEDCFFAHAAATSLQEAHWAAGFRPRAVEHVYNDLIDPVEMLVRGVYCWQQTWWPGRGVRVHYAHTLFNVYVLRCLQFLSIRISLAEIQQILDELWRGSPANQPVLVRDARWLIPLALSLITDALEPYFDVVEKIAGLPDADVREIQRAYVRMVGGHLTSQIRYYCLKDGLSIDDPRVVLRTRGSNALDFALLVWGLVGLLKAYDRAVQGGDERVRFEMAGAIFQGISVDPELFLNRIDLLGAYSMIEHVFIAEARYSPVGQRHLELLNEYRALIGELRETLREDVSRFKPVEGGYSPYGAIFGLPSNLLEHMVLKAVQQDAETRFSLEDVFDDEDTSAEKLAWVNGWRKLPHIDREVQRLFEYPQQFAEDIHARIERELDRQPLQAGRLHVESGADSIQEAKAEAYDQAQLLRDRQEAHFLVSYETSEGWVALKKDLLTEILGEGRDVRITGLPKEAVEVLRLTCNGLVV